MTIILRLERVAAKKSCLQWSILKLDLLEAKSTYDYLFVAKPLPEPMLTYHQLGPVTQEMLHCQPSIIKVELA